MKEEKITFTPNSFIIPGELMLDKKLQPLDTKVFGIIYWLEHLRDGKCTASNATIGRLLGCHPRSVQRSIERLSDNEYIHVMMKDDFTRTGIISNIAFLKMLQDHENGKTEVRSNGRGGYGQMDTQMNNTKKNKEISSETLAQIKELHVGYVKHFKLDNDRLQYLTDVERKQALEDAVKRYRLTPKREAAAARRLKDCGFEMCKKAIINCAKSPWHRGDDPKSKWFAHFEWIFQSYEKVEEWANK